MPYYDEVHRADPRYYNSALNGGTVSELIAQYGIDDVYIILSYDNGIDSDMSSKPWSTFFMADKKQKANRNLFAAQCSRRYSLLLIFIAAGGVRPQSGRGERRGGADALFLGNFSAAAELAGDMDGDEAQAQSLVPCRRKDALRRQL